LKIAVKVEFHDTVADIHQRLSENGIQTTVQELLVATGVSDVATRVNLSAFTIEANLREGLDAKSAGVFLGRSAASAENSPFATQTKAIVAAKKRDFSQFRSTNRWAGRGFRNFVSGALGKNPIRRVYDRIAFTNKWNVERNFTDYCSILGQFKEEFIKRITCHGPEQIWGDLGAGKGKAMRQLFHRGEMDPDELKLSDP